MAGKTAALSPLAAIGPQHLEGVATGTALFLPKNLPFEKWEQIVAWLQTTAESIHWWLGDALNYGEQAYGEKYTQATDLTRLSVGTLANICWVCRRFPPDRRRPKEALTFSHHQEVAGVPEAEQNYWLDRSIEEGLSTAELRRLRNPNARQKDGRGRPPGTLGGGEDIHMASHTAAVSQAFQDAFLGLLSAIEEHPLGPAQELSQELPRGTLHVRWVPRTREAVASPDGGTTPEP